MPPVLWQPAADARTTTRVGEFMGFCEARTGLAFDDYEALWRWSIGTGLEQFWSAVWDFFDVRSASPYEEVLDARVMPGGRWFEGARDVVPQVAVTVEGES